MSTHLVHTGYSALFHFHFFTFIFSLFSISLFSFSLFHFLGTPQHKTIRFFKQKFQIFLTFFSEIFLKFFFRNLFLKNFQTFFCEIYFRNLFANFSEFFVESCWKFFSEIFDGNFFGIASRGRSDQKARRTKLRSLKGLQSEVRPQRGPRLLVLHIYQTLVFRLSLFGN